MSPGSHSPDTERRIAELERRVQELAPRPARRRSRVLVILATVALVIGLPMATIASDTFADVPTSHQFHNDINRLYGSRITAGCGGGNFCPDTAVTRGQMAAFLNRGLGRMAGTTFSGSIAGTSSSGTLGTVTITANNVTGGTAFVQVVAAFNIYSAEAQQGSYCECEFYFYLQDELSGQISAAIYADFDPRALVDDNDNDLGVAVLGFQQVPTGVAKTYSLRYSYPLGTANFSFGGNLTATTYAFAAAGSNSLLAPAFTFEAAKEPSTSVK